MLYFGGEISLILNIAKEMVLIENDINNAYNFSYHPVICHRAWSITAVCMLLLRIITLVCMIPSSSVINTIISYLIGLALN